MNQDQENNTDAATAATENAEQTAVTSENAANGNTLPVDPVGETVSEIKEGPKDKTMVEPTSESTNKTANEQPEKTTKPKMTKKNKIIVSLLVIILLAAIGILVWYFVSGTQTEPQKDQIDTGSTSEPMANLTLEGNGLSDFDLTFLKLNNDSKNIIYSPLSIKYALGMLADGAEGDSKTQIDNLLGNYQPKAYLNSANRSLANGMFVRTGSVFSDLMKSSYTDGLKTKYGASVIYDSFETPDNANKWISDETLGIINNLFNEDNFNTERDFALINALAIDMEWNNQLQCTSNVYRDSQSYSEDELKCKYYDYNLHYTHEDYSDDIDIIFDDSDFTKISFNNDQNIPVAEIGASANRYDIIKELGEDYIRETVQTEFNKWLLQEGNNAINEDSPFNLDKYMEELKSNYGKLADSTDFLFYDSETEKVFAKDLREYDGGTLEYVGIMPKNGELGDYIKSLDAEDVATIINNLKTSSDIDSYNDGVVTKIHGSIPFFNYDYNMESFKENLQELGVVDVFDKAKANLSNMVDLGATNNNAFVMDALHKADIDFSNDGIKAAAATVAVGGFGASGGGFNYEWEVPIEEIDLTFDKPFLFIIRDKVSGEVWFTGAVYEI